MKPALVAVGGSARLSSSRCLKRKRTYTPPPRPACTSHGSLSCGTPLGPRWSVHGPRPPAAGNTRRNGPASRGKPTRLRRGLGMLGSRRLQVGSLLASSAAARAAAADCWLDRSGEGRCGRAVLPGSLALGREGAIGAEPARRPALPRISFRGGELGAWKRIPAAATTRVQVSRGAGAEGRPPGRGRLDLTRVSRARPDLSGRRAGSRGEGA